MYFEAGIPYFHQSNYHYNRNETNGLRFTQDPAFFDHNLTWGAEYQEMFNGYDVESYRGRSYKEWGKTVDISSIFIEDKFRISPRLEVMLVRNTRLKIRMTRTAWRQSSVSTSAHP
jgi:hypothetical protein